MVTLKSASVIDLFCGAGGLSHGFFREGFNLVAGIDIDENCRYAYESNNDAPFICRDISSLSKCDIDELYSQSDVKILVGCAPCQPFSAYNQGNNDPKWRLVSFFGKLVAEVKPDIVSMENVPRLLKFKDGAVFKEFKCILNKLGYRLAYGIINGADYGLPQLRSRLVLVASRMGDITLPKPTHKNKHITVRDAIGDMPPIIAGGCHGSDAMHRSSKLSPTNLSRIRASVPGGTWRDWSSNLVASCHNKSSGKGYSSVYGRMCWEKPSPTITTQFPGFGNGRFGHPEQDRALSLREGAILQGFPDNYKFVAPGQVIISKNVSRMIGNAVPVTLSQAIAKTIKSHITRNSNAT